jgi:hypothetical protein
VKITAAIFKADVSQDGEMTGKGDRSDPQTRRFKRRGEMMSLW